MPETKTETKPKRAEKGSIDTDSALLVRWPKELRARVQSAAKGEQLSEAEWIRQACEAALPLEGAKKKRS